MAPKPPRPLLRLVISAFVVGANDRIKCRGPAGLAKRGVEMVGVIPLARSASARFSPRTGSRPKRTAAPTRCPWAMMRFADLQRHTAFWHRQPRLRPRGKRKAIGHRHRRQPRRPYATSSASSPAHHTKRAGSPKTHMQTQPHGWPVARPVRAINSFNGDRQTLDRPSPCTTRCKPRCRNVEYNRAKRLSIRARPNPAKNGPPRAVPAMPTSKAPAGIAFSKRFQPVRPARGGHVRKSSSFAAFGNQAVRKDEGIALGRSDGCCFFLLRLSAH